METYYLAYTPLQRSTAYWNMSFKWYVGSYSIEVHCVFLVQALMLP